MKRSSLGILAAVLTLATIVGVPLANRSIPSEAPLTTWVTTGAPTTSTSTSTSTTTSTATTTTTPSTTTTTAEPAPTPAIVEPADWPWGTLADCESGTWTPHTADHPHGVIPGTRHWDDRRGGYEGGLHFAPSTWDAYRPPHMPANAADATPADQITVAIRVRDGVPGRRDLTPQGWAAWPSCSTRIGVR